MSVLIGSSGVIEITRSYKTDFKITFTVSAPLIDTTNRWLTLDAPDLVTGDRCVITSISTLFLLRTPAVLSTTAYVFNDGISKLRFYDTYADAIAGKLDNALPLTAAATGSTTITPEVVIPRILGEMTGWTLDTNRASLDTTQLGEDFGTSIAGLITGQGSLEGSFSYENCVATALEQEFYSDMVSGDLEPSVILHQLLLRVEQGGEFTGTFYLLKNSDRQVFQRATCLITGASIRCSSAGVITSSIAFVTKGEIQLAIA
ncbi:MAG: hypothetical protein ACRC4J_00905 [Cetobacterium sp.]